MSHNLEKWYPIKIVKQSFLACLRTTLVVDQQKTVKSYNCYFPKLINYLNYNLTLFCH